MNYVVSNPSYGVASTILSFCEESDKSRLNATNRNWRLITLITPFNVGSNFSNSYRFARSCFGNMANVFSTFNSDDRLYLGQKDPIDVSSTNGVIKVVKVKHPKYNPAKEYIPVYTLDYNGGSISITRNSSKNGILLHYGNRSDDYNLDGVLVLSGGIYYSQPLIISDKLFMLCNQFNMLVFDLKSRIVHSVVYGQRVHAITNHQNFLFVQSGTRVEKFDVSYLDKPIWINDGNYHFSRHLECSHDGKTLLVGARCIEADDSVIDAETGKTRFSTDKLSEEICLWNNHVIVSATNWYPPVAKPEITFSLFDVSAGKLIFTRKFNFPNFDKFDFKVLSGTDGLILATTCSDINRIPTCVRTTLTCCMPCWDSNRIDVYHFEAKDMKNKIKK